MLVSAPDLVAFQIEAFRFKPVISPNSTSPVPRDCTMPTLPYRVFDLSPEAVFSDIAGGKRRSSQPSLSTLARRPAWHMAKRRTNRYYNATRREGGGDGVGSRELIESAEPMQP